MKTLFITLSTACAAVVAYFGVRYFMHRDLGLTGVRKYVRSIAENLRHKLTAARETAATPNTPNG